MMESSIQHTHRPIKELPRSFGSKRRVYDCSKPVVRFEAHSRTASRDTGSRTNETDSSNPLTSDPESTNSTSAPSTPPQVATDVLITDGNKVVSSGPNATSTRAPVNDGTTFKFTNLPRIARSDFLLDPLAAARVVLNYSTHAQQALSHGQALSNTASLVKEASEKVSENAAQLNAALQRVHLGSDEPASQDRNGQDGAPSSADQQTAFSIARMQAQQEDDEYGPELTVYEHSVNKKKRKSGRVTYMEPTNSGPDGYRTNGAKGDLQWYNGEEGEYPQDEEPGREYANTAAEASTQEAAPPPPPPRLVYPKPHLSWSARQLLRVKQKFSAQIRFRKYQRRETAMNAAAAGLGTAAPGAGGGDGGQDGKDQASEKKPQRRATKAESRAKVRGGGTQKMSLAALKAKIAEERQAAGSDAGKSDSKAVPSKAGPSKKAEKAAQVTEPAPEVAATETPPRAPTPPVAPAIRPPSCSFTFSSASPIASRLVAMRAEVEMLQSKLTDSLRPIDEAVAAAADVLTRMDAGEDVVAAHAEAAAALSAAKSNLEAIPGPLANSGAARTRAQPAPALRLPSPPKPPIAEITSPSVREVSPAVTPITQQPAPLPQVSSLPGAQATPQLNAQPQTAPPKISRRKKANMNNIHHRTNYVPSRMPSDPPPAARGPAKNVNTVNNWDQPPGMDHPTTTSALFANEWMCLFCEYELLYGELPSMARACRRRKKLVGTRKRAQDRAHRAAGGETEEGGPGSSATDKKKSTGKKKGRKSEAVHECCQCTCGTQNTAEWEEGAPFITHGTTAHSNADLSAKEQPGEGSSADAEVITG
ncbi:hypothetical protein OC846_001649 [Tilletia horrida]|uniref:Uncharacterized protein n=1 Tax=Tilletia horrida TaxID=155126 RepID=A0AAN6GSF4_9BASI|nr:hypothetical protein OC845_003011 [Tilletia horrida]KAK0555684.1 hypothetical protein OC846_001649 [Tilletia horrida]KAK0568586.1 hypothetical protein OC861_001834 [Tilletia horrida]